MRSQRAQVRMLTPRTIVDRPGRWPSTTQRSRRKPTILSIGRAGGAGDPSISRLALDPLTGDGRNPTGWTLRGRSCQTVALPGPSRCDASGAYRRWRMRELMRCDNTGPALSIKPDYGRSCRCQVTVDRGTAAHPDTVAGAEAAHILLRVVPLLPLPHVFDQTPHASKDARGLAAPPVRLGFLRPQHNE
jgi:hypothetical protein